MFLYFQPIPNSIKIVVINLYLLDNDKVIDSGGIFTEVWTNAGDKWKLLNEILKSKKEFDKWKTLDPHKWDT